MSTIKRLRHPGIGFVKPSMVTYFVTGKNIKELFLKYCTEYVKYDIKPEVEVMFYEQDGPDGPIQIPQLAIKNYITCTDADKERYQEIFLIDASTTLEFNFDKVLRRLFDDKCIVEYSTFSSITHDDEPVLHVQIIVEYSTFEEHAVNYHSDLETFE